MTGVEDIAAVCNDGEIELMKVPLYLLQVSTRKKYKVCLCWKVIYTLYIELVMSLIFRVNIFVMLSVIQARYTHWMSLVVMAI